MKLSLIAAAAVFVVGCASLSTADLLKLDADNAACVQNAPTKVVADACRAQVNAAFCAEHPGKGSMCSKDAGAE